MEHLMNKIINNNNNNNKNNKNILNKTSLSDFIMENNFPLQKIRCAIYTRKSCEDGLDLEYNSLENQYDACASFVKNHESDGWFVINKRYDDGGFSGGNLDRPALKELLNDVNLGLIDKIIIYKLDRISRSNMDYYKLADILQRKNVDIEIATQQFDKSTSIGRFSFGMMLNFAQLEREMTSDRIKEKIRKQQSLGMWTGGITPIGYDVVDKKLIINEYESNIVKTIFNTYYKTKSINSVLDVLNKNNFKTKLFISKSSNFTRGGTNFNRGSIYKILNNKIYIGKIENKVINKVFDGLHEAIIDEDLFNQVQEILKESINTKMYDVVDNNGNINNAANNTNNNSTKSIKKYLPKKNSKMPYLLKGMMRCECCDSILTPVFTTKKKNGISYRYYKPNKAIKHSTSCRIGNIPAEQIENIVLNQIYNVLSSPSIINGVAKTINELKLNESKLYESRSDELNNTNNGCCNNDNSSIENFTELEITKYLKNIQVVWNELFPKEQMQIVRAIIKEIIISEFNVKIIFNNQNITDLLIDAGMIDISKLNSNSINSNDINNNNNINGFEDVLNVELNNNKNNKINNKNKISNYSHEVNIPVDFRYKAGRSFITTPAGKDISIIEAGTKRISNYNQNDLAVISAIIKAEAWKNEIETKYINISYISKRENKTITYITRILNLSFLAPDIKKAILSGQAGLGITLLDLYKCANEVNWSEQRRMLNI